LEDWDIPPHGKSDVVSSSKPREMGYWRWKCAEANGASTRERRKDFMMTVFKGRIELG
jgi:hypothetical protein